MKAPGFGERKTSYLEDIAILTGAQVVKDELGLTLDKVCPMLSPLYKSRIVPCTLNVSLQSIFALLCGFYTLDAAVEAAAALWQSPVNAGQSPAKSKHSTPAKQVKA